MEIIGECFGERGFPQTVVSIHMAGNRSNTTAAYESAWGKWADWCSGEGVDPLSDNLAYVLEFLADVHASGKFYSTINVHSLMLSKT